MAIRYRETKKRVAWSWFGEWDQTMAENDSNPSPCLFCLIKPSITNLVVIKVYTINDEHVTYQDIERRWDDNSTETTKKRVSYKRPKKRQKRYGSNPSVHIGRSYSGWLPHGSSQVRYQVGRYTKKRETLRHLHNYKKINRKTKLN